MEQFPLENPFCGQNPLLEKNMAPKRASLKGTVKLFLNCIQDEHGEARLVSEEDQ